MKPEPLDLLISGLLDGTLDESSRRELNRLLLDSPAARARYRRACSLHGALIRRTAAALPDFLLTERNPPVIHTGRIPWKKFAIAALIPLGFAALVFIGARRDRLDPPVAEILSTTRAAWPSGTRTLTSGMLPSRTPLELTGGLLELGYPSGARVVLEGPCRFSLDQHEALTVHHGRASVHAPPGAEGFRLDTPAGRFIDRGTEFGVAVGSDGSQPVVLTEVFTGEIEVKTSPTASVLLGGGESRAIVHDGSLIDSIDESQIHLANGLRRTTSPSDSPATNLAFGKPVFTPGYCSRPHGSVFPADNLTDGRLDDSGVPGDWSFWLAPDGENGEFTVDLLEPRTISRIELQNTANRAIDDRGTAAFTLLTSLDNKSFTPVLEGELPRVDASLHGAHFPFHDFRFATTEARFVKLVVTARYRHPDRPADHPCQGGGLNEIRIFSE